jgi:hypothetical protein
LRMFAIRRGIRNTHRDNQVIGGGSNRVLCFWHGKAHLEP